MYKNLNDLFLLAKQKTKKKLAVVCPYDRETLKATMKASDEGLIIPYFVGEQDRIVKGIEEIKEKQTDFKIIPVSNDEEAAKQAVELVKEGHVDFLMKGSLPTSELMKSVVNKDNGIVSSGTISHLNFIELENYPKLISITDVAIVINPSFDQKIHLINNALRVYKKLGYESPKIAALCAIETVNPKMPETIEANKLKELNVSGDIKDCIIEGPISFDIAMDKDRAFKKSYGGKIKGDADILLVPNLLTGNILSKSLGIFAKSKAVGMVVGAKCPIVLTSRGASWDTKYESILACLAVS